MFKIVQKQNAKEKTVEKKKTVGQDSLAPDNDFVHARHQRENGRICLGFSLVAVRK